METTSEMVFYTETNPKLYRLADFVILKQLGSYGHVFLAKNKQNKYLYAIKKVNCVEEIHKTTMREISLLKILQHPNIITFYQTILTENYIYMVFEYMLTNLEEFINEGDLAPTLVKSFMFQLLQGILFCHNRQVLHRDIKPQNILIHHNKKVVKLADFGLARQVRYTGNKLTPNVVTFPYKSPELLMKDSVYSKPVDMWSLGCVFVEMVLKKSPFRANCEVDMWYNWFRQLGVPKEEELPGVLSNLDLEILALEKNDTNPMKLFEEKMEKSAFDLATKMFIYNPAKRIDACEALHHDYFKDLDKTMVPAINEENVGFPFDHRVPKGPQLLHMTQADVNNLIESGEMEHANNSI